MRFAATCLLFLGVVGPGCDNGKMHLHPESGPDAPMNQWWQPMPGQTKNWDIQYRAPFDVSADRAMYDLDLWALTPATTIDYGDGSPVTVPAGPLAGKIAEIKARGTGTIIVCRITTGTIRTTDPDFAKLPASVVGELTMDPNEPDERFIDIRAGSRAMVANIFKRFDLAKEIGCDAIDADRTDIAASNSGFEETIEDQRTWFVEVARQAHNRKLSVGMRNGVLNGLVDQLVAQFDWLIVERCGEYDECDLTRPFINAQRAVFAIDYQTNDLGEPQTPSVLCNNQQAEMVDEGLVKDAAVTSTFRQQCVP